MGPLLAVLGIGVYVWFALQAPSERDVVGLTVIVGLQAYDLALPVAGTGLLLARLPPVTAGFNYGLFNLVLVTAVLSSGSLASWLIATSGAIERFFLVGPASCILAGTALIAPDRMHAWLAPIAALAIGTGYGIAIRLYDPTSGDWRFAVTLIAVAAWLITVPFLIGRRQRSSWFGPATRIVGG